MILLHGRGGSAQDMLALAEHLALPDIACLAPEAAGNSWWPQSFLAPIAANEPGLSSSLAAVGRVAEDLERQGFGRERTVLLGFSQGACLALEYAARSGAPSAPSSACPGGSSARRTRTDHGATISTATRGNASTMRPARRRPCSWAATSATRTFPSPGCARRRPFGAPRRGGDCRIYPGAGHGVDRGGGALRARPPQPLIETNPVSLPKI